MSVKEFNRLCKKHSDNADLLELSITRLESVLQTPIDLVRIDALSKTVQELTDTTKELIKRQNDKRVSTSVAASRAVQLIAHVEGLTEQQLDDLLSRLGTR